MEKQLNKKNKNNQKITKITVDRSQTSLLKNFKNPEKESVSYPIFLERDSGTGTLYNHFKNLSNTQQIAFFENTDNGLDELELAEDIRIKIAEFLRDESYLDFECHEFIHFIKGVQLQTPLSKYWDYEDITETDLKSGDVIDLITNGKSAHMALYLSNGLYLSKAGKLGKLVIMTLENMKKFFGGKDTFKLNRK